MHKYHYCCSHTACNHDYPQICSYQQLGEVARAELRVEATLAALQTVFMEQTHPQLLDTLSAALGGLASELRLNAVHPTVMVSPQHFESDRRA